MTAELDLSLVPPLGEPRVSEPPVAHEVTLPSGLHVVVVPRPGVPLVELRLRVPFAAPTIRGAGVHTARTSVLAGAVLLGTAAHDQTAIAELLQAQGAEMSVSSDADRLLFSTTMLSGGLAPVLAVLAELLTSASYPADRVEGERERVAERIGIARSQPGVIARTALAARRYGSHPYSIELPDPELVMDVRAPALRRLHGERIVPAGSSLVLVGDLDPRAATDAIAAALEGWVGTGQALETPPAPELSPPGIELVHRPGAVQSNIRLGGPAPGRTSPDLARTTAGRHGASAATSPPDWWRTSGSGAATPTARAAPSTTRRPGPRSWSRPTWPPRSPARRCWRPGTSWGAWPSRR